MKDRTTWLTMARRGSLALLLLTSLKLAAAQATTTEPPPAPYVNAAAILELPEFIPGAGALYVDPAHAPVGPLSAMRDGTDWDALAAGLLAELGVTVDHVDVSFNGGHPGMAEPHYHVRLAVVDHATQQGLLNP